MNDTFFETCSTLLDFEKNLKKQKFLLLKIKKKQNFSGYGESLKTILTHIMLITYGFCFWKMV
jgi:hypothetical protein